MGFSLTALRGKVKASSFAQSRRPIPRPTGQLLHVSISEDTASGFIMRPKPGTAAAPVASLLTAAFLFTDAAPAFQPRSRRLGERSGEARIKTIREERACAEVRVRHHTPRLLLRPNEPIEEPFGWIP